jgi:hypothetical protein
MRLPLSAAGGTVAAQRFAAVHTPELAAVLDETARRHQATFLSSIRGLAFLRDITAIHC